MGNYFLKRKSYIRKPNFFLLFFSCLFIQIVGAQNINADSPSVIIDQNFLQQKSQLFYLKFEAAYRDQEISKSLEYLRQAISYDPTSIHLLARRAEVYKNENLLSEAAHQYEAIIKKQASPKFIESLAGIYALRGLEKDAITQYDALLKHKLEFSYLLQKSAVLIDQAKYPEALKSLKQTYNEASNDDQKAQVLLAEAYIYGQQKQLKNQKRVAKKILTLQLESEEIIMQIAKLYMLIDDKKTTLSLLLNFQNNDKASPQIAKMLFNIYKYNQQKELAYSQVLALKDSGDLELEHYLLAVSFLLEKHQYDKAIPFIKDLQKIQSYEDYYHYLLAAAYEKNHQWELSVLEYQKIKDTSPYFMPSQIEVAQIFKDQGQPKKSIRYLDRLYSKKLFQNNADFFLVYSQSLWDQGHKKKSFKILNQALTTFPNHTEIHFLKGVYLAKSGKIERAINSLDYVLTLDDGHAEALNMMAYTLAEKNKNLDQAEQMAKRAVSLQPNSSYFLDTMGWVYFQKREYKKALDYFEKALNYNSRDGDILKHLAAVHYELGNFDQCAHFLKQALLTENDDEQKSKLENQLASLQSHLQ